VSSSVTASVTAATKLAGANLKARRPYTIDPTPSQDILWSSIAELRATQMRHTLPATLEELLLLIEAKQQLPLQYKTPVHMQIAMQPFTDDGATRWGR
jgi:hypothetical protein